MERGKDQGVTVSKFTPPQPNPLEQLQAKYTEVQKGFSAWLARQSLPVEAAVVTTISAAEGAAIGALMANNINNVFSSLCLRIPLQASLNPQAMATLKQTQAALSGGPLVQARNVAVLLGVKAGISCVLKRLRGKEDAQSSTVAAFGSGAMFFLVSGVDVPNQAVFAVSCGVLYALIESRFSQFKQKIFQPPAEDVYYSRTRSMLNSLGLQNYEKNFKRGLLTDSTLPLLTDRKAVGIFLILI